MYTLDELPDLSPAELVAAMRWADTRMQAPNAPLDAVAVRVAAARLLLHAVETAGDRYLDLAD